MIEQYVLDELKKYKEENEILREKLINEENRFIKSVDEKAVEIELIPTKNCVEKLTKANIDLNNLVDEMGSKEIMKLIIELGLYKDKIKSKRSGDENTVVKVNNKYYELTRCYNNEYRLENEVYITLEDAVYNELVDQLYDNINSYLKSQKEENKDE